MVWRVIARREETTTVGSSPERASAASASRRLLTDSSNAGGRSRNEIPTSEKTWTEGRSARPAEAGARHRPAVPGRQPIVREQALLRSFFPRERSWELLTTERAGPVVAVHRPLDPGLQRKLQRARDPVDDGRNPLGLSFGEPTEHVMPTRLRSLPRWLSN